MPNSKAHPVIVVQPPRTQVLTESSLLARLASDGLYYSKRLEHNILKTQPCNFVARFSFGLEQRCFPGVSTHETVLRTTRAKKAARIKQVLVLKHERKQVKDPGRGRVRDYEV